MEPDLLDTLRALLHNVINPIAAFPDEGTCRQLFFALRFPKGFVCPRCGALDARYAAETWRCRTCDRRTSLTSGTWLHGTRQSLQHWFAILWHTASPKGISAKRFHEIYGVAEMTAWRMLMTARRLFPPWQADAELHCEPAVEVRRVLGRRHGTNCASAAIFVEGDRLLVATAPTSAAAVWYLPARMVTRTARLLIESLRTWISGTFHGVTARHFRAYVEEFIGRWRHADPLMFLMQRVVTSRAAPTGSP